MKYSDLTSCRKARVIYNEMKSYNFSKEEAQRILSSKVSGKPVEDVLKDNHGGT